MEIDKYEKILNDFVKKATLEFNDSLKLILLIGSYLSGKYINNWSDIDLIIVLDELNEEKINVISMLSNCYDIKIGITLYSQKEIDSMLVDSKTIYYFYLYNTLGYKITYSNKFTLPYVSKEVLLEKTRNMLLNNMHVCKRNLIYSELSKNFIKYQFKIIYSIMKTYLIINDIYPLNYEETFNNFSNKFNFERFNYIKFIDDFKNDRTDIKELKYYSLKLIKFIEKVGV